MRVVINGEAKDVPEGLNLRLLLEHLSLPHQRIAVEVDKHVIRRADWDQTPVNSDSCIEIVHFVGGG
jgi:thiamine biosynthesis protein ThiS